MRIQSARFSNKLTAVTMKIKPINFFCKVIIVTMDCKKTRSFIKHEVCAPKGWISLRGSFFSGKKLFGPQSQWILLNLWFDEEHFTYHQRIYSEPGSRSEVYANQGNELSPEVFQITQFLKQLAGSLFPFKLDTFTFSSSFEACPHTFQVLHYKQR